MEFSVPAYLDNLKSVVMLGLAEIGRDCDVLGQQPEREARGEGARQDVGGTQWRRAQSRSHPPGR